MSRYSGILPWAVALGLLSSVLAVAAKNMDVDMDLFHEMALYRQMESEGKMPTTDDFAYTPTIEPVVHHEWATGAVLYIATVKLGWGAAGLVAIKYFLTFAVCLGCFLYAKRQGASLAVFAFLSPLALIIGGGMAFTNIRAQLFTLLFLVALFFLLTKTARANVGGSSRGFQSLLGGQTFMEASFPEWESWEHIALPVWSNLGWKRNPYHKHSNVSPI